MQTVASHWKNIQYTRTVIQYIKMEGWRKWMRTQCYTLKYIIGRKQRAKNVNNNVAIWDYRETATHTHPIPQRANNFKCDCWLHCTSCTPLLLKIRCKDKKFLIFWAVFLCLYLFYGFAFWFSLSFTRPFVFSLFSTNNSFAFLWRFTVIFYSIIVDRIWIPQRQKNEYAKITQQTRKIDIALKMQMFAWFILLLLLFPLFAFLFHLYSSKSILYQTLIYGPISNKYRWLHLSIEKNKNIERWTRPETSKKRM